MKRQQKQVVALVSALGALAVSVASAQPSPENIFGLPPSRTMSFAHPYQAQPTLAQIQLEEKKAYFQAKRLNAMYRSERGTWRLQNEGKLTEADIQRIKADFEARDEITKLKTERVRHLYRKLLPPRLSPRQYNQLTGTLAWPSIFTDYDRFDKDVQIVEALLAQYAIEGGDPTSRTATSIRQGTERLRKELAKMHFSIGIVDGPTYITAKSFLNSLQHQTRLDEQSTYPKFTAVRRTGVR